MMMGLERIERMRMFAAELTATASPAPRASRLTGSGRTPPRRSGEVPAAEPPQETGLQGRSRQSTRVGSASSQVGSKLFSPCFLAGPINRVGWML
jgi:hypothetical protein